MDARGIHASQKPSMIYDKRLGGKEEHDNNLEANCSWQKEACETGTTFNGAMKKNIYDTSTIIHRYET